MDNFPFHLETYFFVHQEVRANPEHNTEVEANVFVTQMVNVSAVDDLPDNRKRFTVELVIKLDEKDSVNSPYFFTLGTYGIFGLEDEVDFPTDEERAIALQSGAVQILVGAARERIASLTARGPWGAHILDVMSIVRKQPAEAPAPKKKKGKKTG